jgi:hypothetical protein
MEAFEGLKEPPGRGHIETRAAVSHVVLNQGAADWPGSVFHGWTVQPTAFEVTLVRSEPRLAAWA